MLPISRRISIAPMMDWTHRFQRYFMRLITRHSLLYTEMIHANALLKGDRARLLAFDPLESPLAIQLGGSDPHDLAEAAKIAADWGYDEINLNAGCPSDRVQSGRFGACLLKEPEHLAKCLAALQAAVTIPVTLKCRIGVDRQDSYEDFVHCMRVLTENSPCRTFIVHARSAWLKGLSPKENREIPPLKYDFVYQLKQDFPELTLCLNGGITTLEAMAEHLEKLDGVMIGRQAYHEPYLMAQVDRLFYGDPHPIPTREEILDSYRPFAQQALQQGAPLSLLLAPLLGLYYREPHARAWRTNLTQVKNKKISFTHKDLYAPVMYYPP